MTLVMPELQERIFRLLDTKDLKQLLTSDRNIENIKNDICRLCKDKCSSEEYSSLKSIDTNELANYLSETYGVTFKEVRELIVDKGYSNEIFKRKDIGHIK